jgi:hypothetical protein
MEEVGPLMLLKLGPELGQASLHYLKPCSGVSGVDLPAFSLTLSESACVEVAGRFGPRYPPL